MKVTRILLKLKDIQDKNRPFRYFFKPLPQSEAWIHLQIELIFIWMVVHRASLWWRGLGELGNWLLCHFGCYVAKAKLFCVKRLVPVPWLEYSYKKIFICFRDLANCKKRDLGKRASPASHMNTSEFLQRKEWRGEISETEPARLTGLLRGGPYGQHTLGD